MIIYILYTSDVACALVRGSADTSVYWPVRLAYLENIRPIREVVLDRRWVMLAKGHLRSCELHFTHIHVHCTSHEPKAHDKFNL